MTSGAPLIYAFVYPKIHKKYPNFGIFTLQSADHKASNSYSEVPNFFEFCKVSMYLHFLSLRISIRRFVTTGGS